LGQNWKNKVQARLDHLTALPSLNVAALTQPRLVSQLIRQLGSNALFEAYFDISRRVS
jgi:hypothetical protein